MLNKLAAGMLAALLLTATVVGEEPEQPAPAAEEPEQQAEQRRSEAPEQEEFDPTEEIEEDYSVPFPVDI